MATVRLGSADQPMSELNTTPLIDVLLVLLILFVITIPAATHSLELDLPSSLTGPRIDALSNKVVVTADERILWNGSAVSEAKLAGLIAQTRALPVEPALQFEPEAAARYARAAQALSTIKASGASAIGIVGNDRYAAFDKPR